MKAKNNSRFLACVMAIVLAVLSLNGQGLKNRHQFPDPVRTITITSTELLNVRASPVSLLPAPGVGKYYIVYNVTANYHFGTAPYTNTDPDALDIAEGTSGNQNGLVQLNDNELINSVTTSRIYQKVGQSLGGPVDPAGVTNQPLLLENLSAAELAGGDGDLKLTIDYAVETF